MKLEQLVDDFWLGLSEASFVSWVGALLLCFAEFVACVVAFTEPRFAHMRPEYLMETAEDEYMQLSIRLNAMRLDRSDLLQVAYVGASQATRGLDDLDPAVLSRQLSKAAGFPAKFHLFSANDQRFEESLLISDQLPDNFRGLFVMVVTDYKDDLRKKDLDKLDFLRHRIAVNDADTVWQLWRKQGYPVPGRTGVFFIDHLGFFAARRASALRLSKAWKRNDKGDLMKNPFRLDQARQQIEKQIRHIEIYGEKPPPTLKSGRWPLTRITENMAKRNIPVIFIENCQHPYRRELRSEYIAAWEEQMRAFAVDHGAAYWNFNADLDLSEDDFFDSVHVGSKTARQSYQKMLMDRLGDLRDQFGPDGKKTPSTAPAASARPPAGDDDVAPSLKPVDDDPDEPVMPE